MSTPSFSENKMKQYQLENRKTITVNLSTKLQYIKSSEDLNTKR